MKCAYAGAQSARLYFIKGVFSCHDSWDLKCMCTVNWRVLKDARSTKLDRGEEGGTGLYVVVASLNWKICRTDCT